MAATGSEDSSYFTSVPAVQQQQVQYPPGSSDYFAAPPVYTPGSLVVIGHQFCSPVPLDLVFLRKSVGAGDYSATDAAGRTFFRSEARIGFHDKRVLLDKSGNNLLFFQSKAMTLHDTWFAYTGIEANEESKLFMVRKSSILQLKTGLDVFLASNVEQKKPDFRVEGKYMAREYTVYSGEGKVLACGKLKKNAAHYLYAANTYDVHIEAGADSAFIIALMLIVDELHVTHVNPGGGAVAADVGSF